MYVLKMEQDKSLVNTINSTIYQGDDKGESVIFMLPKVVGEIKTADCSILLRYVLPDGVGHSMELTMSPVPHNRDYLQYYLELTTEFTKLAGDIKMWLTAINFEDEIVFHTGEALVAITAKTPIEEYLPPERLNQLDQLAMKVDDLEKGAVDNLVYSEEEKTLQLVADGVGVGDCVDVKSMVNQDDVIYFKGKPKPDPDPTDPPSGETDQVIYF